MAVSADGTLVRVPPLPAASLRRLMPALGETLLEPTPVTAGKGLLQDTPTLPRHLTPPRVSTPKRKTPGSSTAKSAAKRPPSASRPPSLRPKPTSPSLNTISLRNDRLGTLVRQLCASLEQASSWEDFVSDFRGPSYLANTLDDLQHPAAELLRIWRDEGVPVNTDAPPWTDAQKTACIRRGCHYSARQHAPFLRDEMADFMDNKFWMVLPYVILQYYEELFLSPAAVKDERDRRPRLLCDHSFPWDWLDVNSCTIPHAPPEAMQFGKALLRCMFLVRHCHWKFGPPRLAKHDVSDGFYRMFLQARACLRLAILLPSYEGETPLVGVPMSCTMGWTQSPPTFSTMSETVCDLANAWFQASPRQAPPHRLEDVDLPADDLERSFKPRPRDEDDAAAQEALRRVPGVVPLDDPEGETSTPPPPSNMPLNTPLGHTDVFVDDYIQLGQGGPARMRALRVHLWRAIDMVLSDPSVSTTTRKEAMSLKKLKKGDGSWATRKLVLGWIIDTIRQTIELPPYRKIELAALFSDLHGRQRISRKAYEKALGKLRFLSVAIPGCAGLFGAIQAALNKSSSGRVRITVSLRAHLDAFASLAASLGSRPTYLAEIVPQEPSYLGATDAAKAGMGGVYFDALGHAFLWREPFPDDIQANLVAADNPSGTITNSDLEQAALLAQISLQAIHHELRYVTTSTGTDNTPALSRLLKGSTSCEGPAAHLCNYACRHQRRHRYCHVPFFLPGTANVMADDASRLQSLSNTALLAHFNQRYPQPQPWQLQTLPTEIASALTSALRSTSPPMPTYPKPWPRRTAPLPTGSASAAPSESPAPSVKSLTPKPGPATCSSSPSDTADKDVPTTLSALLQWTRYSWPSARASPTWVDGIPAERLENNASLPYSALSSKPSPTKMTPKRGPTRSTSRSSEPSVMSWTRVTPSTVCSTPTSSTLSSSPSSGSSVRENTVSVATPTVALPHSSVDTSTSV